MPTMDSKNLSLLQRTNSNLFLGEMANYRSGKGNVQGEPEESITATKDDRNRAKGFKSLYEEASMASKSGTM